MASSEATPPPFLVAFFDPQIKARGPHGAILAQILTWSDRELENHHDYIQTLFPLPEQSMVTFCPLITRAVFDAFRASDSLRDQLGLALTRMLAFYGLQFTTNSGITSTSAEGPSIKIIRSADWNRQKAFWVTRFNHNHLRLTRIIRSLRVLGLEDNARALHSFLLEDETVKKVVGQRTFMYWRRAAERPLHLPPEEDNEAASGVVWLQGY